MSFDKTLKYIKIKRTKGVQTMKIFLLVLIISIPTLTFASSNKSDPLNILGTWIQTSYCLTEGPRSKIKFESCDSDPEKLCFEQTDYLNKELNESCDENVVVTGELSKLSIEPSGEHVPLVYNIEIKFTPNYNENSCIHQKTVLLGNKVVQSDLGFTLRNNGFTLVEGVNGIRQRTFIREADNSDPSETCTVVLPYLDSFTLEQ